MLSKLKDKVGIGSKKSSDEESTETDCCMCPRTEFFLFVIESESMAERGNFG